MQLDSGKRPFYAALQGRDYRWFFISGLGMTASQFIQQLALAWLVLDLTGSVGQLGLVIFMQGLPWAVMSLFGGVFADRYSKLKLLLGAQFVTMTNMLVLSTLTLTGVVQVEYVYVSSILLGMAQALTMPARSALVASLVPMRDMMNAVALNTMQQQSSRIIWPSIAGVLISVIDVGWTLAVCAIGSFVGILSLSMLRSLQEVRPTRRATSALYEIGEGIRYSLSSRPIAIVVVLGLAIGTFGLAFQQLAPGFAREEMGFSSREAGFFVMAGGIGATLGSTMLILFNPSALHRLFLFSCAGFATSLILISANPWYATAFVAMGSYGLFNSNYAVTAQTIFQLHVPPRLLGRVVSLWGFAGGLGSMTALPIGLAGEVVGLRYALSGVATMLIVLTVVVWKALPLKGYEPEPDEAGATGSTEEFGPAVVLRR